MALIRDWRKDLERKSIEELRDITTALQVLNGWRMFRKEYPETRTFLQMVEDQLQIKDLKPDTAAQLGG